LNTVYSQILLEYPNAKAEIMICPTNASWEADVIILSNAGTTDVNLIEKIRNVATGKIVLFLENKKNMNTSGNTDEKLQHLFPFSKVVQSFESADNSNDSVLLKGKDEEALKTILTLFTSTGLKANII
jgi:predicted dinucleotide-binding enzyme